MTKAGNVYLRGMLFMPAMAALQHNPICIALAARLEEKGISQIAILGAIMHKLFHLMFGVLKNQTPFNPNYLKKSRN